jgi:pimeloyl-ACP methyl ester carboxylesterase
MMTTLKTTLIALTTATVVWLGTSAAHAGEAKTPTQGLYRTVKVDGLDIFYREAGPQNAPTVLLHGFPTSSHMFRNLIPALEDKHHVVAPDYPGYGNSSAPSVKDFEYTFDILANVVEKFTERVGLKKYLIYLMDYGAPVGFRLAVKHPERGETLIVQKSNAYNKGIDNDF